MLFTILFSLISLSYLIVFLSEEYSLFQYEVNKLNESQFNEQQPATLSSHYKELSKGCTIEEYKLIDKLSELGLPSVHVSDDLRCGNIQLLLPTTNSLLQLKGGNINYDVNIPSDFGIQILDRVKIIHSQLSNCMGNNSYFLNDHIFKGGHGEVWRAYKISVDGYFSHSTTFILKRMHVKEHQNILECALREIYFGKLFNEYNKIQDKNIVFNNHPLAVTRFIKYFNDSNDYWLVFHDEGISLQKLLYITTFTSNLALLEPSALWKKMRITKSGSQTMKGLLHHLIATIADLHSLDIIHRDIKPSNILINTENEIKLLIGDFSSAVNNDVINKGLYGIHGPSTKEETLSYAPPEVLLSLDSDNEIPYDPIYKKSYDVWSIGIVFLEMILGTANVFDIDQRSSSIISKKMKLYYNQQKNTRKKQRHKPQDSFTRSSMTSSNKSCDNDSIKLYKLIKDELNEDIEIPTMNERNLLLLIALIDYCIYDPNNQANNEYDNMNSNPLFYNNKFISCNEIQFQQAILKRDPLGLGFRDKWGIDLLYKLLKFNPKDRISLKDALNHAYFHGPYYSTIDNKEFATYDEMLLYDQSICSDDYDLPILIDQNITLLDLVIPNELTCDSLSWLNRVYNTDSCEHLLPQTTDLFLQTKIPSDIEVLSIELPIDPISEITFTCPKCNRTFLGNYDACKRHLDTRKHGYRCYYNISHVNLPQCLQDYSIYPYDKHSGWCDLQGRRKYIEDYHSIAYGNSYLFIGVFDGHFGSRGARLSSRMIPKLFDSIINDPNNTKTNYQYNYYIQELLMNQLNSKSNWKSYLSIESNDNIIVDTTLNLTANNIIQALNQSFLDVDNYLDIYTITGDISGSTGSCLIILSDYLLIGHVGDSRIVLCCDNFGLPIVLTKDHTPYDLNEYQDVLNRGGYIDKSYGEVLRVNSKLAITRSLGDKQFHHIISNIPDILLLKKHYGTNLINSNQSYCEIYQNFIYQKNLFIGPLFVILATDGLWDVINNKDAIEMICEYFLLNTLNYNNTIDIMRNAAKILALEAYVRGSTDNIGVCIVDLINSN